VTDLRIDMIGEIIVRGGSMTAGYWKTPTSRVRRSKTAGLHRRLGALDDDDDYWFFNRKSEVIGQRGQLVSPLEVEAALYQHPSVKEVDVAGIPDGASRQCVVAHVVLEGDEPLTDFATAKLPPGRAPQRSSSPIACRTGLRVRSTDVP
jgi:long-chain acyl-CoA synthetase